MTTNNNTVAIVANNVESIESKFYAALGTGKVAASHMRDLIVSVVSSRDTTTLVKAIKRAKEKGDDKAAQVLSEAVKQVWVAPEGKTIISKDKTGKYSIKIKGIEANKPALERLEKAVADGLSIRGATFIKAIKGDVAKEEKPFDAKAWAERTLKAQGDENLDAMIAALQAKRGVNANAHDTAGGTAQ